ncbi:hypothetical protein [Gimesia chilikensis]|uniref:hypothetical protein n=1 Tax=Gimesia chilikensis TaxID=2605989 RepID=UPI003A8CB952
MGTKTASIVVDGLYSGGWDSGAYTDIDEGTDSPNDADYIEASGAAFDDVEFTLTMPADFISMNSATIKLRGIRTGTKTYQKNLQYIRVRSPAESTFMFDIYSYSNPTFSTSWATYEIAVDVDPAVISGGINDKTTWDGAVVQIRANSESERPTIDVTNLSSTDREYLVSIPDGGEISCELNYDPSQHGGFATLMGTGDKAALIITFGDDSSTTLSCDSYLTSFELTAGSVEDVLTASATFKITGEVSLGLVNLLPGVKSSFSDTTNAIAEDLHKLASEQWQDAKDNFNKPWPSEAINKFRKDVQANVAAAAQAAKTGSTQIKESFDEGMIAATDSANKLIDKLKEQIATFGMSATEAELFKLQQQGASQALLDQAKALQNQIDGLEKLKKASEDARAAQQKMKDEAKSIYDATRTPLEKFRAEFLNLVKLFKAGLIDRDTFQRAVAQAKQGFKDATKKDDPKDTSSGGGLSGAIKANSQEARSLLLRSRMAGASPINKVEKNTKEQLAEQKKSNEHLAKLATNKPIIFTYQPS